MINQDFFSSLSFNFHSHINEDKRKTEGQKQIFDVVYEVDGCPVSNVFTFLEMSCIYTHLSWVLRNNAPTILSLTCLHISSAIFHESTDTTERCYILKVFTLCHSSQITSHNFYGPTKRTEVTILWPTRFFEYDVSILQHSPRKSPLPVHPDHEN